MEFVCQAPDISKQYTKPEIKDRAKPEKQLVKSSQFQPEIKNKFS